MIRFENLAKEAKIVYLLIMCDYVVDKISNIEGYELAKEALEKCWAWLKTKSVDGDKLYSYLENLDENDILTYMQLDKNCDNEAVWMCIANALAYVTREAYEYANDIYMPETIECVDESTVESFFDSVNDINTNNFSEKLLEYLDAKYAEGNDENEINILEITQFLQDN